MYSFPIGWPTPLITTFREVPPVHTTALFSWAKFMTNIQNKGEYYYTAPDGQLLAIVHVKKDESGNPYFLASDVCKALGYSNPRDAVSRHCREKGVVKRDTLTSGGVQSLTYLDEPNVYRLVMRSNMPDAEKFQDWVCEIVLPAIRKDGHYSIQPALSDAERLLITAQSLVALERGQQAMQVQLEEQQQKIEQISSGAIPSGWQTIKNLSLLSGLTDSKTRKLISAFCVTSKKVPFMTPGGVLSNVTIADESEYMKAFETMTSSASRPLRGVMWSHPLMGKFQLTGVAK